LRAAKLKEVIERHLPYEIAGLFRFFQILTDGVPVSGLPGQLIHTALVEAFCIHARVLHDFLTNRPGTGVHAKHATHGYKPFANGGIDRKITNKLHDHVAHLTLRRTVKLEEYIGAKERSGKIARRGADGVSRTSPVRQDVGYIDHS
jgi:hypothetical protein